MTRVLHVLQRSLLFVCVGSTFAACRQATESSSPRLLTVRLTRPTADGASLFPGRYTSVVETVTIVVMSTSGDTLASDSTSFTQGDSVVSFEVTTVTGSARIAARVVSNNGTPLFSGTTSVNIGSDDTVSVPVEAESPVLLISLNYNIVQTPTARTFSTAVHNRGRGELIWSIRDTLPAGCRGPGMYCVFNPKGGSIVAGSSTTLRVTMPPNSAAPAAIVLESKGGSVSFP